MADSRTRNTARNIAAGIVNRIVSIIFPFLNRTVILWVMGAEYTGLSGLFSAILEVLSLAELGFNTAIVYCMYKPMAEGDREKVRCYLTLIRKIYAIVGAVILAAGLCVTPFLTRLIHGTYPETINLYALYLLYLLNTVVSYFLFAYKETVLLADQRQDLTSNIRTAVNVIRYIAQFAALLITRNFYVYVMLLVAGTVVSNVLIQRCALKRYPDLICRKKQRLQMPAELKRQVGALLLGRMGDKFRNSFDSIIVSTLFGLVATTVYGNYFYIYSAVYGIMLAICNAMSGSIGNSIVTESVRKNYDDMRNFQFLFAWISCMCTACMAAAYQPFMRLWAGEELLLGEGDMLLFCLYFYLINMCSIRNQYISGTGIWWKLKGSYLIEAVLNLLLNIVLGKIWGVTGILLATVFTIFAFNYVSRTHVLFQSYFIGMSEGRFSLDQAEYTAATLVSVLAAYWICGQLTLRGIVQVAACACISAAVSFALFGAAFVRTERFGYAKRIFGKAFTCRKR